MWTLGFIMLTVIFPLFKEAKVALWVANYPSCILQVDVCSGEFMQQKNARFCG
jgi:hypothetical protein